MPQADNSGFADDMDQRHIDAMIKQLDEESLRDMSENGDLHKRNEAEVEAGKDRERAMFFDKDTFEEDGHMVPATDGIYDKNKAGYYTKPNMNDLLYWLEHESGEHFMSMNQGKEVFIWRDGCYTPGMEGYLRTLLQVVNNNDGVTPNIINQTIHRAGSMSLVDGSKIESDWGDTTVLNNCVLNTKTCEITPHVPDLYVFSKLSCDHVPGATCPVWMDFIEYALPDPSDQKTFQEMFGFCLIRGYTRQVAFFLLGAGGNGKGVAMDVLRALLGSGKTSAVPLQQVGDRFYSTDLYGRYANISGDTSPGALLDGSTYKMLTGGDFIRGERKGKDAFEFRNHAKIINSMNELMPTKDQTDGFFRRFVLIRFDVKPTPERVQEKWGFVDDIIQNELPGILNWAIDGLMRLNKSGGFTWQLNKTVDDLRKAWNVEAERVNGFIGECCERKGYIEPGTFYHAYTKWHVERYGTPPKDEQGDITKDNTKYGFSKNAPRKTYDNAHLWDDRNSIKCYNHISLKNTDGNLSVYPDYVDAHWHEITGLAQHRAKTMVLPTDSDRETVVRNAIMEILSGNHTDAGARVRHISEKTGIPIQGVHKILLSGDEFVKTSEGDWKIGA